MGPRRAFEEVAWTRCFWHQKSYFRPPLRGSWKPFLLAAPLNSVAWLCALCPGLSLLTSSNFFWSLFVAACLVGGRTEPAPQPQIRALPVRPGFPPPQALAGPGLVLLLSSVAGLCVQALSSSCPFPSHLLKRCLEKVFLAPKKLFQATSYKDGLRGSWKPFLLAALCVQALSSSCPLWLGLGHAPELCGWALCPGLLERSVAEQTAMSTPTKIH